MKHSAASAREAAHPFICRDLSWIDFNGRVLDEAGFPANPLLERLKFIAIASSNLDEFFMVRIAGLRHAAEHGGDPADFSGLRSSEQLACARKKIDRLLKKQHRSLQSILLELEKYGVRLRRPVELPELMQRILRRRFQRETLPVLTPFAVDAEHPFPILSSGCIEIAVELTPAGGNTPRRAFVEVPECLDRFVEVDSEDGGHTFVLLEELILDNLDALFPGSMILDAFPFRITRDMDLDLEDRGVENLMLSIGEQLRERKLRDPIRLEYPAGTDSDSRLLCWLRKSLKLERGKEQFVYASASPLHLKQFMELVGKAALPELLEEPWHTTVPAAFAASGSVFEAIRREGSILLAVPYHSFSPLIRMLKEAADDPDVLAIKQTLYRVSGNSPVVHALQRAAERGKQVTVLVELKARFDEDNNINWALRLERSGAHVVYGIAGLKVHCKALLVVRREAGEIRRYLHLGTGNYNDRTATQYTDLGIMTCDPELAFDAANLFNLLTGFSAPGNCWRQVAVAPFTLRSTLEALIGREIRAAEAGRPAAITAKMNSLSDPAIISLLHRAADAGVKIDLIVRGICCYRPVPGQENVQIISIVDRYLEHSRVFSFLNDGAREYYLSSADWMTRNLDRRIELFFPVRKPELCAMLQTLLEYQLEDSDKRRKLTATGVYTRPKCEQYTRLRSQSRSSQYFHNLAGEELRGRGGSALKVFTSTGSGERS